MSTENIMLFGSAENTEELNIYQLYLIVLGYISESNGDEEKRRLIEAALLELYKAAVERK